MKQKILIFLMVLMPFVAWADVVEINGIYYKLISKVKTAEVTSNPDEYTEYIGTVVVPASVTYEGETYEVNKIGYHAFAFCRNLNSVTIPSSIQTIGQGAFQSCTNLTSFTIPNSVTKIDGFAFSNCTGLTSITIPSSVSSIGESAFWNCSGLNSINLSNSLTYIDSHVFDGCIGLTSISIPNSVTSIGSYAFANCKGLSAFSIPNSVTSTGEHVFSGCTGLKSVTFPNSIASISQCAFSGCSSLSSVTIPNSVRYIDAGAFEMCSDLKTVIIGSGVKDIYSYAFFSCPNLESVFCYAESVPRTSNDTFKDSYIEYATLHVLEGSKNAYLAVEPWKNFYNIVAIDEETPDIQKKCEKPTISYLNGQLLFSSATDGVLFDSEITDSDIKKSYEATITLSATYNIRVYATKDGYENSDVATATLCWIDKEPITEGVDGISQIRSNAVLIQCEDGIISLQGIDDGIQISAYTADGVKAGSAISRNGGALLNTNLRPGTTAIVKLGEKSVKLLIK